MQGDVGRKLKFPFASSINNGSEVIFPVPEGVSKYPFAQEYEYELTV